MKGCKIPTKGAKQWLEVLKRQWNISYTFLNDSSGDSIVILHEKNNHSIILVAQYSLVTKEGIVYDRRGEARCTIVK